VIGHVRRMVHAGERSGRRIAGARRVDSTRSSRWRSHVRRAGVAL